MPHPSLTHRGGLADRLYPDPSLFGRIGGRPVIARIIDGLYDRIEQDPALRPMFTRTLTDERMKQKAFFEEWMGGEPGYTHHHAYGGLKNRHRHIHITREAADRWLNHMRAAVQDAVADASLIDDMLDALRPLAYGLVNEGQPAESPKDLRCHRENLWRKPIDLAAKGRTGDIQTCIEAQSRIMEDPFQAARVMHEAALRGHVDTLDYLLANGADVNLPASSDVDLMMTPLCAAQWKQQHETADFLLRHGAKDDIFSACFLGRYDDVKRFVEMDSTLANARDPACDVLPVTPLHHAVYGDHEQIAGYLLGRGAEVGTNSTAMIRHAADRNRISTVRLLLDNGADASRIGPGAWVTHKEVADLLLAHGADVNYPAGQWIWGSCTGNNSQRDNPEYVQRLIDCGADIHTRLRGAQALHYAAKAGHTGIIRVLLESGAPVNEPDDKSGETPLFYAFKAGKRADLVTTIHLLLEGGADIHHPDKKGRTPKQITARLQRPKKEEILRLFENW